MWASISALKSFAPRSGVHEWALRIDKSDRGHVFVGVVSADASMESYIGSDRYIIHYDTSVIISLGFIDYYASFIALALINDYNKIVLS